MKLLVSSLLLLAAVQVNSAPAPAYGTPALEFDFTGDEGCDSNFRASAQYAPTNGCAGFSTYGNQGAQVKNLLDQNVNLQLFTDASCDPSSAVFGNSTLVPGTNSCFADIGVANAIIVTLA